MFSQRKILSHRLINTVFCDQSAWPFCVVWLELWTILMGNRGINMNKTWLHMKQFPELFIAFNVFFKYLLPQVQRCPHKKQEMLNVLFPSGSPASTAWIWTCNTWKKNATNIITVCAALHNLGCKLCDRCPPCETHQPGSRAQPPDKMPADSPPQIQCSVSTCETALLRGGSRKDSKKAILFWTLLSCL